MLEHNHSATEKLIGSSYESMDERTKKVARHIAGRKHISSNPSLEYISDISLGQRAADAVAKFGGSWIFIILFGFVLICWVVLNSYILANYNKAFDPYPYILLNLFLSMLASIQAPIILMSQNRQAEIDRLNAASDYEINLKAELEIMLLHEKIDLLREGQWTELVNMQRQQMDLLGDIIKQRNATS